MISVIILAAGQSQRMGQSKMALPWGGSSVLQHVIKTLATVGEMSSEFEIIVISGGWKKNTEMEVASILPKYPIRTVHNPNYKTKGMVFSLQMGLAAAASRAQAALIGLGDQPQIQEGTVRSIVNAYQNTNSSLIVPSFQSRRGHPWLVSRPLWDEILNMDGSETLRDFLNAHTDVYYVEADESILLDIDTPDEYQRQKPV